MNWFSNLRGELTDRSYRIIYGTIEKMIYRVLKRERLISEERCEEVIKKLNDAFCEEV